MLAIAAAVLLAVFLLHAPWGIALVVTAIVWEIAEKTFWFTSTRRIPLAVGPETLLGRPVEVVATCRPDGTVRLSSERWNARCREGADVGDTVIIESLQQLTLIVSASGRAMTLPPAPRRRMS
jgi:membrane protein implicated in regulation of membrane protease activity